ncbi:Acyl-CoA dehydrogenase, short-chain specific [Candidatus Desulfarcum epimagneticum]|uniref:Acyl-CoA dehydrogenase, short-chain specific n=1 Tax=uncultured Desulfobacteraceae bacterium TaxID=218296 RepID=A0A484HHJ2_9BACT|nr:Acyl-CoA dehydrogenase, short-chain specific [uncultured Desulfobacteraceae bacterium]
MTMEFKEKAPCQTYFGRAHEMIRRSVREFVQKEVKPFIDEWEKAGTFPREIYRKAGEMGILGIGYPEELGGTPGDIFFTVAANEEIMRSGSGGFAASLGTLHIALPPIVRHGTERQKEKFVKPVIRGERIAALAVTEPGGGSDVAAIQTGAVDKGDHFVVNGSKTFITNGGAADHSACAVRTGGPGHSGISLLVIESDSPGYSTSAPLKKTGWRASNTAEIFFNDCVVPKENLIGEKDAGFYIMMENFQGERLALAVMAYMTARMALEEALEYSKKRKAFGKTLAGFQVTRHKLADMTTLATVAREFALRVAAKMDSGIDQIAEVSMAKNFACSVCDRVVYDAVQIFGGYGYMEGFLVERLARDSRILSIGGGTTEMMKEIIAKSIF